MTTSSQTQQQLNNSPILPLLLTPLPCTLSPLPLLLIFFTALAAAAAVEQYQRDRDARDYCYGYVECLSANHFELVIKIGEERGKEEEEEW